MPEPTAPDDVGAPVLSESAQREAMAGIADLIEEHYVFTDVGAACAAAVRALPPQPSDVVAADFAARLTTHLRETDRHFAVAWGAASGPRAPATESAEPAMSATVVDEVGILTIRRFDDADDAAAARVATACLAALDPCRAVIIDVRDNGGGWPSMVEFVLAPFFGPDPVRVITFTHAQHPDLPTWTRPNGQHSHLRQLPVFAIVNEHTASAAECLAYVLQSTGRATITGHRTVGAANPVEVFPGPLGCEVFVPTGAPIDPRTGTNWEGIGVAVDVSVDDADALARTLELAVEARRA